MPYEKKKNMVNMDGKSLFYIKLQNISALMLYSNFLQDKTFHLRGDSLKTEETPKRGETFYPMGKLIKIRR